MNDINKLLEVMAQLRDPDKGCPWDIDQDFASIAPYTVEEAYEVADAIERGEMNDLREELGDLLLQVVFHAQMAREQRLFDFADVARGISEKLVRRHPHVFAGKQAGTADDQHQAWEAHKTAERLAAGKEGEGVLDGLTTSLPALTLAAKTGKRAARVGFDWTGADAVIGKLHEELAELERARQDRDKKHIAEEFGDLLLAMTSLARHLEVNPEQALRQANRKFSERFTRLEASLARDKLDWSDVSADELEERWQEIKM
ncbi:MAG: nucleoside triphosphate pyrophosphohydrolase [Gammaproteobacteria bacterium]|jgi:MazG family protein|nr:nucleoside triphosphate pyrophosphohydrolase [Gammaproteobacteria bacterium]MDP6616533.1 nucleoside triphosphate pyrophosphohydrolase [Gammaproteobacteria bacterium]MDP6694218.1 nucleoside triphosphate pyrophosphohydrolase [Gammaproteobacteria bacterium]MDP7042066.1 nucleoside triphosphate pyrophosphohydrolase [Gammaproteobacteria bacterium]